MKNADNYDSIDVAMDIVRYVGEEEEYKDKFLVLEKGLEYQENRDRYAENKWEVPGGKIELDKDEFSDLEVMQEGLRELYEETELFAVPKATGSSYEREQEEVRITFHPVYVELGGNSENVAVDPEEHETYEWIDGEEFRKRMTSNEIEAFEQFTD